MPSASDLRCTHKCGCCGRYINTYKVMVSEFPVGENRLLDPPWLHSVRRTQTEPTELHRAPSHFCGIGAIWTCRLQLECCCKQGPQRVGRVGHHALLVAPEEC